MTTGKTGGSQRRGHWLVVAGMAILFVCERYTPLGFAHGTLYIPLLLLAALSRGRRFVLGAGAAATALTLAGIPISPDPVSPETGYPIYLGNRLFSIIGILITTGISLFALRVIQQKDHVQHQLRRSLRELQQQQFLLNVAGQVAHIGGWVARLPEGGEPELSWSDEVCRIHGVPPGQQPTLDEAFRFYRPGSVEIISRAFRDCVERGTRYDLELEITNRRGEALWVRTLARPVRRDGRTVEVHGTFQDITDEKNRELNLQESRLRFRQLADLMPLSVWTADAEGRPDFINRALRDHIGNLAEAGAPVSQWLQVVHPEDRRQALRLWASAIRSGEAFEKELRLRRHDGSYRWHLARAMPATDSGDKVKRWFGLAMDIDERKAMEEQVRRSEERFRYLSRATTDAVWDWDPIRRELWWNEGLSRLFGYEQHEIGTSAHFWLDHIHPEERERVHNSILEVIRGEATEWHEQYRFLRRDGTAAYVSDNGYVIRDQHGRAVRMVGGMSDITAERSLQEQLQQSERLRAVGELSGGMAHDFNNLLTVITGNTELLAEQLEGQPGLQNLVRVTRQAADRGAELTRRMLAFARRQPLQPEVIDLRTLLEHAEPLLRRTLRADIEVEVIHAAGLWNTRTDPAQLENSLINLCLNARDAMPEGGRLTIETANTWMDEEYCARHDDIQPGQYVQIAVSDTGNGIDEEVIDRVFDPFFSTRGKGRGTGLGLSMVYGFVKQSGGHIKIYSEPGQGTTVRLYLPRSQDEAEHDPVVVRTSPDGGSETVLVVEDDEPVRDTVCHQLRRLGYTVREAADAATALALFMEDPNGIDILFTDIVLPGDMNGKQLADRVREIRPALPILFTSGYTRNAIVHHGRLDSGVVLLSKPYRRNELARRLRQVLDRNKAG